MMLARPLFVGGSLLWVVSLLAPPAFAELRWKFAADQQWTYELTETTDITMVVGDRTTKSESQQTLELTWKVTSVRDDGTAVIEQRLARVRMATTTDLPLGGVRYDSATDADADQGAAAAGIRAAFAPWIDVPLEMLVSPRGTIEIQKLPEGLPDSPTVSAESLQQLLTASSLEFPAEAVEPGGEWSIAHAVELPGFGKVQVSQAYKLAEMDGEIARIESRPTLEIVAAGDRPLRIRKQSGAGKLAFDAAAGSLQSSEFTRDLELELPVANEKIPITIKQAAKMTRK